MRWVCQRDNNHWSIPLISKYNRNSIVTPGTQAQFPIALQQPHFSAMEIIKTFMKVSSIHGLNHISMTVKYSRFFWIIVVILGFTGAGFMTYQSFKTWNESPIKTTEETRPIRDIRFPKITPIMQRLPLSTILRGYVA